MTKKEESKLQSLKLHYSRGTQDVDQRRTRKNGWNDTINAYMGKLPKNWPYNSVVTVPLIRSTILEKTARLLNAKLQGRLVPREGGDIIKAKINNALLDFQWDFANEGGSMIEKVSFTDQITRLYGSAFVLVFWDVNKESNEIKLLNPNDVWFDGGATHSRNAKWVDVREFTNFDALEARGYNVTRARQMARKGEITSQLQSNQYLSQVKENRGLEERNGENDDPINPVVEIITEWTATSCTIYLPKYDLMIYDGKNPYKHGKIPVSQLRYYPLGDDIYGEIEVESVIPLQRAANALICGFIDEVNLAQRPPLKISSTGVRIETIEYGPGARWIMQNPNLVEEAQIGNSAVQSFNTAFPAIIQQFNTAMGDQSLGISSVPGKGFNDKTATEVKALGSQQNNRDQYNQLYLSEFLKDIMLMWMANNKQYLFDDPTKNTHILKIIGKDNIQYFKQMKLDETDIPDDAMHEISQTIMSNPSGISGQQIQEIAQDVSVPTNPVITNPDASPDEYDVQKKLDVKDNGEEADLYLTPDDFEGDYDYIPDVASMAAGASNMIKDARQKAIEYALNPQVQQMLAQQGESIKIKELLVSALTDGGYRDAEGLFTQNGPQNNIQGGPGTPQPGQGSPIPNGAPGVQQVPPPQNAGGQQFGIPSPQGF